MADAKFAPIAVVGEVAEELGRDLEPHSFLLGYLFGRAVHDDRRLLTDRDHLRAYARSILKRPPPG